MNNFCCAKTLRTASFPLHRQTEKISLIKIKTSAVEKSYFAIEMPWSRVRVPSLPLKKNMEV